MSLRPPKYSVHSRFGFNPKGDPYGVNTMDEPRRVHALADWDCVDSTASMTVCGLILDDHDVVRCETCKPSSINCKHCQVGIAAYELASSRVE